MRRARRPGRGRPCAGRAPADRAAPGRAGAGARRLCRPAGHPRHQRDGHGPCAGCAARPGRCARRGGGDHRQGLSQPRMGLPLPRGRPAGRPRPLQRQQGGGRDHHRQLPRCLFGRARRGRRHRAGGQCDRRRRLGGRPPAARRRARLERRAAAHHPPPRGHAPLAACDRAAGRLPVPGRAAVGRPRPRRGLQLWPAAARGGHRGVCGQNGL